MPGPPALARAHFRAVVFDIGGVLQITPPLGTVERWEDRLGARAILFTSTAQAIADIQASLAA
jgi:hypothetical protein